MQSPSENEEYLNYEELCLLLKIAKGTAYSLVSRRQIPHVRLSSRLVRFEKKAILSWLEVHQAEAVPNGKPSGR